ncbi:outer membrane protein assembly factor BamB family protein [Acidithiobacillus caldus]|uniref:outer membrane protein assembly factor BamB family protein n=2 Tax=Acidithiobacillus caldus TaxID=33059 RepID=UPI001D0035B4|nr:PQQ-binding-like beta-propeller repeat protein [Acidithiobacillus caldus]
MYGQGTYHDSDTIPTIFRLISAVITGSFLYVPTAAAGITPTLWPMYAFQPGHNAFIKLPFPAVSWTFEVPGAAAARKAVLNNTTIRDLVGFPIGVSVADHAVFAPNDNGYLYKLQAKSGKLDWAFDAYNQLMTTPVVARVAGKTLVFVGAGNSVFTYSHARKFGMKDAQVIRGSDVSAIDAVDAATGKLVWTYRTKGEDMPSAVFDHGMLIFGNGDGHVYALDAANGALKWKTAIQSFVSMSSAALDPQNNVVIVGGTHPSNIYALDATTGRLLWKVHPAHIFSSSGGDGTWAVADGLAIGQIETRTKGQKSVSNSEELAIDIATGKVVWSTTLGTGKTPPRNKDAVPAVDHGVIYTGSPVTHREYAINVSNGRILWTTPLKVGMKAAPTIVRNTVIQPTGNGNLFTLDRANGKVIHVANLHQGGYGPQNGVALGKTFFIGTNSGYLQAIPLQKLGVDD